MGCVKVRANVRAGWVRVRVKVREGWFMLRVTVLEVRDYTPGHYFWRIISTAGR